MKSAQIVLALVLACFVPHSGFAQSETDSILEDAEKELVELFSLRAIDFSSSRQTNAIRTLESLRVRDARFNQPALKTLTDFSSGDIADSRQVDRAIVLLGISTVPVKAQLDPLLDCYVRCSELKKGVSRTSFEYSRYTETARRIADQLEQYEVEMVGNIVNRMQDDKYPMYLLELLGNCGDRSGEVLTAVMKTARSDDSDRAEQALFFAASLINKMKEEKAEQARLKEREQVSVDVPVKFVSYARRIITRYDKNKDGSLGKSEYSTMLISPEPADGDKDGEITILEYAKWMASRAKEKAAAN
ncbi:MAG: hypothetical protein AAFX06_10440 [Planctomycetota bacterium]